MYDPPLEGSNKHMKFEQFVEIVKQEVMHKVGLSYSVTVNSVLKVNRELHGISVGLQNAPIVPSVYLEEFYSEYMNGKSIDQIAKDIIEVSQRRKLGMDQFSINMTDFEWVKSRLRVKLINYARNEKLLQDVPNEAILDLAIVPYVLISKGEELATVMVKFPLMEQWNVSAEELLSVAKGNTIQNEPVMMERMSDFIFSKLLKDIGDDGSDITNEEEQLLRHITEDKPRDSNEMYIISNRSNINGAFVVFQPDQLSRLAERIGVDKLYILPSSIHEMLAIPANNFSVEHLREMVKDVNRTTVTEDEFLSDEVYLYNGDLCIV
jgi:hypothetical protein